jgi:hypothetical protein
MKTKHKTLLIVFSILFGITMHALGYLTLSLFGTFFTDYISIISEPDWFVGYTILALIPNAWLAESFYNDYTN